MRTVCFVFLLACCSSGALASTYYLANAGNDSADGRSPGTAWQTLNKLNSVTLAEGDEVLFKRGEVFRGEINSNKSPKKIHFSAFGNGDRPVIAGSLPIGGWQPSPRGAGIWEANVGFAPSHLFANGKLMTIARYPNVDSPLQRHWLKVGASAGTDAFTDPALASYKAVNHYWQGATLRIRNYSWTYTVLPVTGFDAATGKITATGLGSQLPEWGYFLDGKLEELDVPNEWFYEASSQKVYFYPANGKNPNQLLVEGSVFDTGLTIANYEDGSSVGNLVFRHFTNRGIHINSSAAVTVRGCHFEANNIGMSVWNTPDLNISQNTFNYSLHQAIVLQAAKDFNSGALRVENNIILNTGMFAGYGRRDSGVYQGSAIVVFGKGFSVRGNMIKNTSYSGIDLKQDGYSLIENNVVLDSLLLLNDGGAIQISADGDEIRGNILLDSVGNFDESNGCGSTNSTPCSRHSTYGMGIGSNSNYKNNVIENNVVANHPDMGIRLNAFLNTRVAGNIVFNTDPGIVLEDKKGASSGNTVEGNIIFAAHPNQLGLSLTSDAAQGAYRNNVYCNPYSDLAVIRAQQRYSLPHWQRLGQDAGSRGCNVHYPDYLTTPVGANQITNSTFEQGISGWSPSTRISQDIKLDGHSLRVDYPNNDQPLNVIPNTLSITQGKWYKLAFTALGNGYGDIQLRGNRTAPDYVILQTRHFALLPERRNYAWVFPASESTAAFKFLWTTDAQDTPRYWLDNVTFEEVTAQPVHPQILSKLFINPLPAPRAIRLGNTVYRDLNGQEVKTSLPLPAYGAQVLLYQSGSVPPPAPPALWVVRNGVNLTLAWSASQDASGYRLYYTPYPDARQIQSVDLGLRTDFSIDLWPGAAFYIALTAFNAHGESDYSNITWFAVP